MSKCFKLVNLFIQDVGQWTSNTGAWIVFFEISLLSYSGDKVSYGILHRASLCPPRDKVFEEQSPVNS
ncbi:hypothetical protein HNQ37_000022 [Lactovum miscens]|uniref:Uncharacterized protein n=1 Tax=Lactovum miscens TaxID=190387 RepID=A0A841C481_9LACT|nr:hypothetical protein [Lactovum miscens]MBB5887154.1 hypothetical protein [Lactovum miscens]